MRSRMKTIFYCGINYFYIHRLQFINKFPAVGSNMTFNRKSYKTIKLFQNACEKIEGFNSAQHLFHEVYIVPRKLKISHKR